MCVRQVGVPAHIFRILAILEVYKLDYLPSPVFFGWRVLTPAIVTGI